MAEGWLAALIAAQEAAQSGNQAGADAIIGATQGGGANLGGSGDWWSNLAGEAQRQAQSTAALVAAQAQAAQFRSQMDALLRQMSSGRTNALPPSFGGLGNSLGYGAQQAGGSTPLAAGFPIVAQMVDMLLRANADRRAGIDQQINLSRLLVDLQRVSPTRAADMAVRLGLTNRAGVPMAGKSAGPGQGSSLSDLQPVEGGIINMLTGGGATGGGIVGDLFQQQQDSFGFTNLFGTGARFASAGGPRIGGMIGNERVSLPSVFSGQELDFFGKNPNVARVTADIADKFGLPDIFERSMAARIPTLSSILSGGFG